MGSGEKSKEEEEEVQGKLKVQGRRNLTDGGPRRKSNDVGI